MQQKQSIPREGKEGLETDDCIGKQGRRHDDPALQTPSPQLEMGVHNALTKALHLALVYNRGISSLRHRFYGVIPPINAKLKLSEISNNLKMYHKSCMSALRASLGT